VWNETGDAKKAMSFAQHRPRYCRRKEKKERRVEILDIEGEFEHCYIYPEDEGADDTIKFGLYNIIVAVVGNKKFCLYKTE